MNIIEKFKQIFEETEQKFSDFKLEDGTIVRIETLEAGSKVELVDEAGEVTQAPEGEYTLEDGTKLIVDAEGLISEVVEVEVVEEKMEEVETPESEVKEEVIEKVEEDKVEFDVNRVNELEETVLMIMDKLKAFEEKNGELANEKAELEVAMKAIKEENKILKNTTPAKDSIKFKKIETSKEVKEVKELSFSEILKQYKNKQK